jgi:hypothetical protein
MSLQQASSNTYKADQHIITTVERYDACAATHERFSYCCYIYCLLLYIYSDLNVVKRGCLVLHNLGLDTRYTLTNTHYYTKHSFCMFRVLLMHDAPLSVLPYCTHRMVRSRSTARTDRRRAVHKLLRCVYCRHHAAMLRAGVSPSLQIAQVSSDSIIQLRDYAHAFHT